jgi:hypothetical protein
MLAFHCLEESVNGGIRRKVETHSMNLEVGEDVLTEFVRENKGIRNTRKSHTSHFAECPKSVHMSSAIIMLATLEIGS